MSRPKIYIFPVKFSNTYAYQCLINGPKIRKIPSPTFVLLVWILDILFNV